jgi:hypothetical protein
MKIGIKLFLFDHKECFLVKKLKILCRLPIRKLIFVPYKSKTDYRFWQFPCQETINQLIFAKNQTHLNEVIKHALP